MPNTRKEEREEKQKDLLEKKELTTMQIASVPPPKVHPPRVRKVATAEMESMHSKARAHVREGKHSKLLDEMLANESLEDRCARKWAQCMMNPFERPPTRLGDIPYPTKVDSLYLRTILGDPDITPYDTLVIVHTPFLWDVSSETGNSLFIMAYNGGSPAGGIFPENLQYANIGALVGANIGSCRTIARGIKCDVNYPATSNAPRFYSGTVPASGTPGNVITYLNSLGENYWINNPNFAFTPQTVEGTARTSAVWYPDDSQATFLSDLFLNSRQNEFVDDNSGESYPVIVITGIQIGYSVEVEAIQHVESVPDLANVNTTPVIYDINTSVCDIDSMFSKMLNLLQPMAEKAATAAIGPIGGGLVRAAGGVARGLLGTKAMTRAKRKHMQKFAQSNIRSSNEFEMVQKQSAMSPPQTTLKATLKLQK